MRFAPLLRKVVLSAPVAGWTIPLSEVPEPLFSKGQLGSGVAIEPVSSTLCAPCNGRLITLHRSCHALNPTC